MPAPIRFPRSMFIAALAQAGALGVTLRFAAPQSVTSRTPTQIERRGRAVRRIALSLGSAIVAAGRAHLAFIERGAIWKPPLAPRPRLDGRVRAIVESAAFASAIGRPEPAPSLHAPWIEFSPEPPRISIYWRGTLIPGERQAGGKSTSHREFPEAEFREAVAAARQALEAAGHRTTSFEEVRWLRISDKERGWSFEGWVATIMLARPRPLWMAPPSSGKARAL